MCNSECDIKITYYTLQKLATNEKNILLHVQKPDDDCQCENCENSELLLSSIKFTLVKINHHKLAPKLPVDAIEFISSIVCSKKKF